MTYLVAVSGGVDSVCLLDMLSRTQHRLIVAHVDHGIRGVESKADARFVQALARRYGLPFVQTSLNLDPRSSEDQARQLRYKFLLQQAKLHGATVATAHHANDAIETIAINLVRGTGWRGLTVLDRPGVVRPLLRFTKAQLYNYALRCHLEWVEDETNRQDTYLRNRIRKRLENTKDKPKNAKLLQLRANQIMLRRDIQQEAQRLMRLHSGSRYFLTQVDDRVAIELLASDIARISGRRPTRPRTARALLAIKTAMPGSAIDVGDGVQLELSTRTYRVKVI